MIQIFYNRGKMQVYIYLNYVLRGSIILVSNFVIPVHLKKTDYNITLFINDIFQIKIKY